MSLETAEEVEYSHTRLRIVSPIGLLVTKYLTFTERGKSDYYASHDLEDFLTIVDGRERIVEEIDKSRSDMKKYLIEAFRSLLEQDEFNDALPGYLPADSASQARLPMLRKKLKEIAGLSDES